MEVRLLNTEYVPNGWLANQLTDFWKGLARDLNEYSDSHIAPAADVIEDTEGYHFYFEMPGIKADSVDVRFEAGRLVVDAERTRPEWPKEADVHLGELTYGPIRRSFRIPQDARQEGVAASYKDGILAVNLPKRPESKPLKIKVSTD